MSPPSPHDVSLDPTVSAGSDQTAFAEAELGQAAPAMALPIAARSVVGWLGQAALGAPVGTVPECFADGQTTNV